ncbi:MAG: NUDIX hydrolase [Oscillospiraceae bacterium]|nr:NUDIX hydrolase [Oscillospiraceae bacterium]
MTETKLSGRRVFSGRVFDVEVDQIEMDGGRRAEREVVRHPGGVGVLAVDEAGRAVMVRQYRYGAGREMLEIPAGRLEPGEDPRQAALRELREETGARAGVCVSLGEIIPTGAYCSERIYLYLARDLTWGGTDPDDGEIVEIERVPPDRLWADIRAGRIDDAKTIAAVCRALGELELSAAP